MTTVARRCRPLLGTLVEIRVEGLRERAARAALDAAFAEIAAVHRLMSFHAGDSDLARIHRTPVGQAVAIDPRTHAVLGLAQRLAAITQGRFDVTIGAPLVRAGALPAPVSAFMPDPAARWSDIALLDEHRVRLRRALWLDLGGIAKGYAVDRAVAVLERCGARQLCVNAGGDLRTRGARAEAVFLRAADGALAAAPQLELADGAVATSTAAHGVHLDGATRVQAPAARSVSVLAPSCAIADGLTKVVLAACDAGELRRVLQAFRAHAYVHDAVRGWRALERAA